MPFADRTHAGHRLADRLAVHEVAAQDPVVLALPRGGVPVAVPVADRLGAPLDVLVVRKIGAPGREELGLGAIGEGDVRVVDTRLVAELGVDDAALTATVAREAEELSRRVRRYRGGRPPLDVAGRAIVLVDDGIATGGSMRAALDVLAARGAARTVVGVPVAPQDAAYVLGLTDADVVALQQPRRLVAVGAAYDDFRQTTDDEVVTALSR